MRSRGNTRREARQLLVGNDDRRGRRFRLDRSVRVFQDELAFELAPIIRDHHRARLVIDQRLVIDDPGGDRLRELLAPRALRDQTAFAALGQEAALNEDGGDFRQAQDGEAGALDSAIELGEMADHRMEDAHREREARRVDRAAGLHVHKP